MPDLLAGSIVRALDTPPTQWDAQGMATTTSTTFEAAGTDCAVTFTAPTTGRVMISIAARMINSGTGGTLACPETREGAVIGSGAIVEVAIEANTISHYGASFSAQGKTSLLSGLTPGAVYNTRMMVRASAGTGTFANRNVLVTPAT